MKKDKALPFRIVFSVIILLIDFMLIPQLLLIPIQQEASVTLTGWIVALPEIKNIWLWLQPMAVGAIIWIWATGRSLVNVNHGDMPGPSGHGQHGTARWQTGKEVDQSFTSHKF